VGGSHDGPPVLGYVDWAIEGLEAVQPRNDQTAEEIRKLIGFLRNSAERLHYRRARQGRLSYRSGGIEAANKSISHVRLKRSGAWWYLEQANHMLALRCAYLQRHLRARLRGLQTESPSEAWRKPPVRLRNAPYQQLTEWWATHKAARHDAKLATLRARWDARREAVHPLRADAAIDHGCGQHTAFSTTTALCDLSV